MHIYNTSKHESSKHCPFTVTFGRQAILPVDIFTPQKETDALPENQAIANRDKIIDDNLMYRCKVAETVKENIVAAQERQKREYDRKRHNPEVFKIGAQVLRKDIK